MFGEIPKSYALTPALYSSSRNLKCANLNWNINETLLKELYIYKVTNWNMKTLAIWMLITSNQHRAEKSTQNKGTHLLTYRCPQLYVLKREPQLFIISSSGFLGFLFFLFWSLWEPGTSMVHIYAYRKIFIYNKKFQNKHYRHSVSQKAQALLIPLIHATRENKMIPSSNFLYSRYGGISIKLHMFDRDKSINQ